MNAVSWACPEPLPYVRRCKALTYLEFRALYDPFDSWENRSSKGRILPEPYDMAC